MASGRQEGSELGTREIPRIATGEEADTGFKREFGQFKNNYYVTKFELTGAVTKDFRQKVRMGLFPVVGRC